MALASRLETAGTLATRSIQPLFVPQRPQASESDVWQRRKHRDTPATGLASCRLTAARQVRRRLPVPAGLWCLRMLPSLGCWFCGNITLTT